MVVFAKFLYFNLINFLKYKMQIISKSQGGVDAAPSTALPATLLTFHAEYS
jgi:hypothetical protein